MIQARRCSPQLAPDTPPSGDIIARAGCRLRPTIAPASAGRNLGAAEAPGSSSDPPTCPRAPVVVTIRSAAPASNLGSPKSATPAEGGWSPAGGRITSNIGFLGALMHDRH